jgi:hypothetical protein
MMKKIHAFMMLLVAFVVAPAVLFAQGDVPVPPESMTLAAVFVSIGTMAFVNVAVVQFLKQWILKSQPIILSAIVAGIMSVGGYLLKLGIFLDHGWWWIIIYGTATVLVSNGYKDWYKYLMILAGIIPRKK